MPPRCATADQVIDASAAAIFRDRRRSVGAPAADRSIDQERPMIGDAEPARDPSSGNAVAIAVPAGQGGPMTEPKHALRQYVVDAFTDRPFGGNPAAVVLLDEPAPATWMQALAAENNLSETAYLVADGDGWSLRWFTPTVEVDLCGHATLASAHVLLREVEVDRPVLRFSTRSGDLFARPVDAEWIALDLPVADPVPATPAPSIVEALGVEPGLVAGGAEGGGNVLVELTSAAAVRACSPDFRALAELGNVGVIITARGDDEISADVGAPVDLVSRYFVPGAGIDEDPVTGSAHCLLAPYWVPVVGRRDLLAVQVSARRGTVRIELRDHDVRLLGQAVTVNRASLAVGPAVA
jgi:PhzF family phenazine biosynthesis protein